MILGEGEYCKEVLVFIKKIQGLIAQKTFRQKSFFNAYFSGEKIYECKVSSRVRPRFFDQVGRETMYSSSGNKHFFTKSCHHQTYQNYEQSRQKLGTILENKVFLRCSRRLFIILVSLMMTWFSEKMLISTRWIHGFMSNLIKKSWTDSKEHVIVSNMSQLLIPKKS